MPGPLPKNPATRARRNKTSTTALLQADPSIIAPALPERVWNPLTLAWWEDLWASPMAPEYDESDVHGLYMLAALIDAFWDKPGNTELAKEIRNQRQSYGLSPMDRRRLQWTIEQAEDAQDRGRMRRADKRPAPVVIEAEVSDPRAILGGS